MKPTPDWELVDRRVKEYEARQRIINKQMGSAPVGGTGRLVVITISRQFGAGGHSVTEILAKLLGDGWSVWDREIIDEIAKRADVTRRMVEVLDERRKHWLQQMGEHILGGKTLDAGGYKHYLVQVLLALAQQGRNIIIGRGANFVLKSALNVRLEASMEFRIRQTMVIMNVDRQRAEEMVYTEDRERAQFTRDLFDRDIEDRTAYDMILRTDCLGFETTAQVILTAARGLFGSEAA